MLKTRVITALVLAPLTIAAILFLPLDGFAILWGLIILAAAHEWTGLGGLTHVPARAGFMVAMLATMLFVYLFRASLPDTLPWWFFGPVVVWWLAWGMAFRRCPEKLVKLSYPMYAKLLAGGFVLVSAWIMMVWLRLNFEAQQVLYLVLLVWVADAAAYFFGRNWGFTKLAPDISPGKTTEGVYGALFATGLFALGAAFLFGLGGVEIADFVFLSLITVAVSICGDLFESLAKRVAGAKDSGTILPGHGGVLDRIDSLLAGVSVFYAGSLLMGLFLSVSGTDQPTLILNPDTQEVMEAPALPDDAAVHEEHE
ncbi:phosphatidate cytidylyltransferase [Methylomagnum sp.]